MKKLLDSIQQNYEYLIPSKEEIIVLLLLNERIINEEISKIFIIQNIRQAVKDALFLQEENNYRTESILRNLLHYFVEHPADMPNNYKLTEFALEFIKLLENKVSNKFRNFALEASFERYASFQPEEIKTIDRFQEWFNLSFSETYKQTVIGHIEALKDDVRESTNTLNKVLYLEEKNALTIVTEFKTVFERLETKAKDIQSAIQVDIQLDNKTEKVVDDFYKKIETSKQLEKNQNEEEKNTLFQQWQQSKFIQREVKDFFREIKSKLGQLREQIVFASSKLNELPEYFKYQTKVKVNLRKLLKFTLENSRYSSNDIVLPDNFPTKYIVDEQFKLVDIPTSDSFFIQQSKVIEPKINDKHKIRERKMIDLELQQQEKICNWIEECKERLQEKQSLDFTEYFYRILDRENNINIPIQVGYELLEYASNSANYSVFIDKTIVEQYSKEKVIVWQMNITRKK